MNFTERKACIRTLCYATTIEHTISYCTIVKKLHTENILTKEHLAFLETTMLDCVVRQTKLIAGLPTDIKFGHKTGRSPTELLMAGADKLREMQGEHISSNGEKCYIAVFRARSWCLTDVDNAKNRLVDKI